MARSQQSPEERAFNIATARTMAQQNPDLSANKIIEQMKAGGVGIRKQDALAAIREARGQEKKADAEKYTPRKYRQPPESFRPAGGGTGIAAWGDTTPEGTPIMYGVPVEDPEAGEQPFYATGA